jgi:hypothetical protein
LQGKPIKDPHDAAAPPPDNQQVVDAVLTYFARLKSLMGDRLGAYGNGFTNRILRENGLIRYSWVSESRSFWETPQYLAAYNSPIAWHLFQNQIDRFWFTKPGICKVSFGLDTLVQNPNVRSVGAWNADGPFEVSQARTREIFRQRWVAARDHIPVFAEAESGRPLSLQACRSLRGPSPNGPVRNRSVRVVKDLGDWIEVDVDDDGISDGFCRKTDPTSLAANFVDSIFRMPKWS